MNPRPAAQHVEDYLEMQRLRRLNAELASCLNEFVRFAERQGWSHLLIIEGTRLVQKAIFKPEAFDYGAVVVDR